MKCRNFAIGVSLSVLALLPTAACGENRARLPAAADATVDGPASFADGGDSSALPIAPPDPKTCDEAAAQRSYIGCDYWPTITSNVVDSVFDFAVAVANVGAEPANVTVTGNGVSKQTTVAPGSIGTVYLPWVPELKGRDGFGLDESVLLRKGAYHLVSDRPVVVYQFSPLEFRAVGGEPGKDWSACKTEPGAPECYSYSNDASLLLPSTAMTGAYRVMGDYGLSHHPINPLTFQFELNKPLEAAGATAMTITATADDTTVEIELGKRAVVVGTGGEPDAGADAGDGGLDGGDGGSSADASTGADAGTDAAVDAAIDATPNPALGVVPSAGAASKFTIVLNAGDVAQVVARKGQIFDFSGSLVIANKPVQVITSVPCQFHPLDTYACDHVEETVFPAETLGKNYVVPMPTGPNGSAAPHFVRIYGNSDNTTLTYKPQKPAYCPDVIQAGQVFDCENVVVDFEVSGDKAFGVGMFLLGGAKVDPTGSASGFPQGDPSQSFAVAVEQYRQKYVFLAPTDYKTNFVDIVAGADTNILLDDVDVTNKLTPITGTTFFSARVQLAAANGGVHTISATRPVGIQVLGYGDNTSFHYPGGLNLAKIEPPPR